MVVYNCKQTKIDELQLINGTGLDVAGNVTIGGTTTVGGNIPDTTETYDIVQVL